VNLSDLAGLINQVGFPVFVAVVLLLRVDKMHAENIRAINALTAAIEALDRCIVDKFKPHGGD
jgi:hypothetical protein